MHLAARMDLKINVLNERSHFQKGTYIMIPYIEHSGKVKTIVADNK